MIDGIAPRGEQLVAEVAPASAVRQLYQVDIAARGSWKEEGGNTSAKPEDANFAENLKLYCLLQKPNTLFLTERNLHSDNIIQKAKKNMSSLSH